MSSETIAENISSVRRRIAAAAQRAGRAAEDVTLVAVTKTQAATTIEAALAAGIVDCGENRVQEADAKIPQLSGQGARWHLIGHLQRNKARRAAALFDIVHSVDSLRLAEVLNRAVEELPGREGRRLPILMQLNISGEQSKEGFPVPQGVENRSAFAALRDAVGAIAALPSLDLQGLMTVAPYVEDPEQVRWVFMALRDVRDELESGTVRLPQLSMGMSDDFEVAIEEGATIVRVGRAIFGER